MTLLGRLRRDAAGIWGGGVGLLWECALLLEGGHGGGERVTNKTELALKDDATPSPVM